MTDNVNPPVSIASSTKALTATLDLELPNANPPSTHQVDLDRLPSSGAGTPVFLMSQSSQSGNGDRPIQDSTSFDHNSAVNDSRCRSRSRSRSSSLESCDSVKKQTMESTVELTSFGSLDDSSAICNSTGDSGGMQEESIIVKTKCLEKINGLIHTHTLGDRSRSRSSSNGIIKTLLPDCCSDSRSRSTQSVTETCDSGQVSKSTCQCNGNNCDENSCDNVELLKEHSQEVHKDSVKSDVEILLHQLEKTSFSHDFSSNVIDGVTYMVYESEKQMPDIMKLITKDLSEPYSIYTYRYFIHNWPKLCFLAIADEKCVGAIVCKLDLHKKMVRRGYIAMLAVDSEYRRRQIGSTLVTKAIQAMIGDDCDEVVLETEITNRGALHLYENLGFVRDKRLFRYYLNGVDALRLKLWLR